MTNNTKKLEILVVEDNPLHQQSAKQLLGDHNLTVVGTFDEAAEKIQSEEYTCKYDAVLTDMFFTQGKGAILANKSQASQEMPFGYAVALMACKEGTPYVAIVSDANHHSNPIAYTMDFFQKNYGQTPIVQQFGNSKMAVIKSGGPNGKDWKYALEHVMNTEVHKQKPRVDDRRAPPKGRTMGVSGGIPL